MAVTSITAEQLGIQTVSWRSLTWVNIEHPSMAQMAYLRSQYHFHDLALDDCLSKLQLPKVDEYEDCIFLVLQFPVFNKKARVTQPTQVAIFAGDNYIVTVHRGDLRPLAKLFQDCAQSELIRNDLFSRSSGYLLYRILDQSVDYCFPILNKVMSNVDEMEERLLDRNPEGAIGELSIIRRDIIAYRRIIRPQIEVMETLETREYPFLKVDPDVYFGDLADHTRRIWEELEELKEVTDGLNDTMVSMHVAQSNAVLRNLTVIFTVLLPLVLVSGLYGMNVPLPGGSNPGGSALTLLGLVVFSVVCSGGMLLWFRRKGWI